ncbi:hypothetical protein FSP39_023783 [Pinctada imbricata]|uniref:C2H2-type domain-containing protein n=1 Tax=Pinctada imbricata TaxID=66713 RepID=A0AA88XR01_PINIB|nr:hypothetical protein FSP39_023783 [Pinctada imbricata]
MDEDGPEKNCIRLPATSGPRPYKCDVCQRSFREVATLRKHEQLHRADRPYVCNTCGKSFLWSSNLKVHERVHTGERPYKCKICHRCFTQSNDLRRHERNVHQRGKMVNYRSSLAQGRGGVSGHMNIATYQAFAMQQRALLQHALTYESLMHNAAAVTQARFMQGQVGLSESMSVSLPPMSTANDLAVSTSSDTPRLSQRTPDSIKLEQVTPPSSPGSNETERQSRGIERSLSSPTMGRQTGEQQNFISRPSSSSQMPATSGVIHSPPTLPSSTYHGYNGRSLSVNGSPPGPHGRSLASPQSAFRFSHGMTGIVTSLPQNHLRSLPPISSFYGSQTGTRLSSQTADNKVIDLSINKSMSSDDLDDSVWKEESNREEHGKPVSGRIVPPELTPQTEIASKPSPLSETESEEKRDVTTTSISPTADSGIHHCPHCNIYFHDFTMYHLHESLHSPDDEDPFRCPSCQKRCQDRIEFMFHMVWHVKYPHTIPNYEPFKETYQT